MEKYEKIWIIILISITIIIIGWLIIQYNCGSCYSPLGETAMINYTLN